MRLAIISDIHGNLLALETALAEIDTLGVDRLICLGDVAELGPQPHEVIERLRSLACPVVMGNTDASLLSPVPTDVDSPDAQLIADIDRWSAAQLTADDRAFMAAFAPTLTVDLDGAGQLLCYHGSPASFNDQIRATTPDEQLAQWLGEEGPRLYAGGHTHVQMLRRFRDALVLNPGTVGLPYDRVPGGAHNPAWAEYAVVAVEGQRLSVDLRRAPYDVAALRAAALASGMPHADIWAADWV